MKDGWEMKKLEELSKRKDAVVSGPFGSNLKVSDYKIEGVPILRLQNIGKCYFIDKDIKYIDEAKAEELKYHSFISGDIALAKLGIPIGKTCIIPNHLKSGIITADIVRIRPNRNIVDYNFLEYFLNTDLSVSQLTGNISGSTRPRVNLSDVREIEIPIPPLPEQQRIVAILNVALTAIDQAKVNVERNLQNAKELFQSKLNEVFSQKGEGWVEKRLIDVNKFIDYRGKTPHKVSTGIRLITAKNVKLGYLQKEPEEFIKQSDYESWMTRGIPEKGDVLFTTEAPLANVALLDTDGKIALAQRIITFSPDRNTLSGEFLYYCLLSKEIRDKILAKATGATVSGIKARLLKEITIFIPKHDIQKDIVRELDELSKQTQLLEIKYKQDIIRLDELKKSILQKAFNGELNTNKA